MKRVQFHECVVTMLGCVTVGSGKCLVLEYCTNGDLLRYVQALRAETSRVSESGGGGGDFLQKRPHF